MKIAVITSRYSISGVPLAQLRLARSLISHGHEVQFIVGHCQPDSSLFNENNLNIKVLNTHSTFKMIYPLFSLLKDNDIDIIFTAEDHLNVTVLLAAIISKSKAKISASSRVTPLDTYSNIWFSKKWILKQLSKLTMRRADVLTCVSKDMVIQYKKIFADSRHICIYNIVDDQISRQKMLEPISHKWFLSNNYKILIASGSLASWKGFEDLIRAIPYVLVERKVKLLILGDGPLKDHLQGIIENLDITSLVELVGNVDNPLQYYKHSDIFVLSSYVEGMPNVLIEAMMCGCTPVATDCPTGPREVLQKNKYGYLVSSHEPKAIAKAIIQAIDRPISKALLDDAIKPFESEAVLAEHFKALSLKQ